MEVLYQELPKLEFPPPPLANHKPRYAWTAQWKVHPADPSCQPQQSQISAGVQAPENPVPRPPPPPSLYTPILFARSSFPALFPPTPATIRARDEGTPQGLGPTAHASATHNAFLQHACYRRPGASLYPFPSISTVASLQSCVVRRSIEQRLLSARSSHLPVPIAPMTPNESKNLLGSLNLVAMDPPPPIHTERQWRVHT